MNQPSWAQQAASFGGVVDEYERGRPSYPDEAVRWLIEDSHRVIDLGAGTGKLTSRVTKSGVPEVVAIEPQEPLVRRLHQLVPDALVVCGGAERIPVRKAWADAVVVAQAFHWFDQTRAVPEIARVLKPHGRLGLVWNLRDESVDWVAELSRISGIDNSRQTRSALEQIPAFEPFESRIFKMVQVLDQDSLIASVRSRSNVSMLDDVQRANITNAVLRLCATHPSLSGRRYFEFPYVTEAFRSVKN
jgi:SAM-dependent methyltransferase